MPDTRAEINILVLGGKGSGKTCFMLAMYDDMRIGYGGFTFSAVSVDVDMKLVDNFRKLIETSGEDRWPLPSEGITKYEFNLNYALRRFMVFGWHDYRGGIINERNNEFFSEFSALAKSADVIMICAPGDLIYAAATRNDRNAMRELLVAEVQQLLEKQSRNMPPAIILVTKGDLHANAWQKDNPHAAEEDWSEQLIKHVRKVYGTFFVGGGYWRVLVCPVSLGSELATDLENGAIAPQNMHLPVMYAYYHYAKTLAAGWEARIERKCDEVSELQQGWFTKNRTRAALEDLETLREHHRTVQENIKVVYDELKQVDTPDGKQSKIPYFVNGVETDLS